MLYRAFEVTVAIPLGLLLGFVLSVAITVLDAVGCQRAADSIHIWVNRHRGHSATFTRADLERNPGAPIDFMTQGR